MILILSNITYTNPFNFLPTDQNGLFWTVLVFSLSAYNCSTQSFLDVNLLGLKRSKGSLMWKKNNNTTSSIDGKITVILIIARLLFYKSTFSWYMSDWHKKIKKINHHVSWHSLAAYCYLSQHIIYSLVFLDTAFVCAFMDRDKKITKYCLTAFLVKLSEKKCLPDEQVETSGKDQNRGLERVMVVLHTEVMNWSSIIPTAICKTFFSNF